MMHGTVCALIQYIVVYILCVLNMKKKPHFIFPTIKVSMNAYMELVGFIASNIF